MITEMRYRQTDHDISAALKLSSGTPFISKCEKTKSQKESKGLCYSKLTVLLQEQEGWIT